MIRSILFIAAAAIILSGCAQLRQIYGIPDPNAGRIAAERRAALIEQSIRDSSVVFLEDSALYAGRPIYRLYRGTHVLADDDLTYEFYDFRGGEAFEVVTTPQYDSLRWAIIFKSPSWKSVSVERRGSAEEALKLIMDNRLMVNNGDSFDPAKLQKAIRAGILRERPDLDSVLDQRETERRAWVERQRLLSEDMRLHPEKYKTVTVGTPSSKSTSSSSTSSPVRHGDPSVKNNCSRTVQLFIGEKPGYSGGVFTSVSGNSINASLGGLSKGKMLWIVDDKRNPVTSFTVGESTREIQINSDGRSFRIINW